MKTTILTSRRLNAFADSLRHDEKSAATIVKYTRYARMFADFACGQALSRDMVLAFKESIANSYTAAGANGMLTAINCLMDFLQQPGLKVSLLRVQRRLCIPVERELSRDELERLMAAAESRDDGRLVLILQTLFATGARVSELPFFTYEAVCHGSVEIRLKGKIRFVFLPTMLCEKLLSYAKRQSLTSGPVFVTRTGKPLDRTNIWKSMKALCDDAEVDPAKVLPHNLRRLFARVYYGRIPSLAELADVLGHSRVDTTRLYTATTDAEYRKKLDELMLVM